MRRPSLFRQIRLWAQQDEAAERRLREHEEALHVEAAEKKALEKVREEAKAQEKIRLIELVRREAESLQLPRRIMMWEESTARSGISFKALEAILAIQSQMISAYLALVDKKVPLLAPGTRLSVAEEKRALRDIFPKSNRRSTPLPPTITQRRTGSALPGIFSKKRVLFSESNTIVVFSRSPTPSLRR